MGDTALVAAKLLSKPAVPKFLNTYVEFEAKVVEYLAQSQPVNPPCQPGENNPCH